LRATAQAQAGMSIVVPVLNEGVGLPGFHRELVEVALKLRQTCGLVTEVIYVDDGSRDDTLAVARALPADALDLQVVSLSRNFGKEAALLAGLDHARLGAVLFMDGDGQHPHNMIATLVGHWLDGGYDVVYTAKIHREARRLVPPLRWQAVLHLDQLGCAPPHPGGRRRFPAAVAAGRQRAAAPAGAQPILEGTCELDRFPSAAGGLHAGRTNAR
jgi:glycosyltransferase involved in cell wall biosynthesis